MSSEMEVLPLGDLVSVKGGKRLPKGLSLQTEKNSHPYIRVRDMGMRYIPSHGLEYVPDDVFNKIQRYIVHENDVLISIVGTVGLISIIDARFNLASQTENSAKLTGLDSIDAHYLYYYLISEMGQSEIRKRTVGAVQPKLPLYNIESLPVNWPRKNIRKMIVNLLRLIDDKIELTRLINQTLEQMAQALFKSWFVDFEPVKAKMAVLEAGGSQENATFAAMTVISGKDTDALVVFEHEHPEQYAELKATAERFPSAMQESELGEIPKGWESSPLSKKIKLFGGGTPKRSEPAYWNGEICWYSVKDAPSESDIFVVDTAEKITREGLEKSSTKLLPIGTTIISARGTVGKLALTSTEMAMNQSCYGISGGEFSGPLLTYLKVKQCVDMLKRNTHGAVFDTITTSTFETVTTLTATNNVNSRFEEIVAPLFSAIENNLRANVTLTQLRDTLLPKLLSGEITLPEAEQAISEVENV